MKKIIFLSTCLVCSLCFSAVAVNQMVYTLSPEYSNVVWFLSDSQHIHSGAMKVKEGYLSLQNGQISGGRIIIDPASITSTDIKDKVVKEALLSFLNSEHFYDTKVYSAIVINILGAKYKESNKCELACNITIKNITVPLSFDCIIRNQTSKAILVETNRVTLEKESFNIMSARNSVPANLKNVLSGDAVMALEITQLVGISSEPR